MNYKVKVGSEAESKEVQGLLFKLGYVWDWNGEANIELFNFNPITLNFYNDMTLTQGSFLNEDHKEITIPQLKDMVVLKRNDVGYATHGNLGGQKGYLTCENVEYFWNYFDKKWNKISLTFISQGLKPITKKPAMKEFLDPANDYKFIVTDKPFFDWIEVPEGADTLAGDSSTRYFWKHGFGEKGNMIIGVGESLTRYSGWTGCKDSADVWLDCVNDDSFKIIWQRETLNDKVASAEVARQEFIGAPFSDLPESDFEAVDDFVESNVEQGVKHPHYKKDISHLDTLDIYRVTELFNPHACGAHIAKKALCSGQRGHKDLLTDIQDIIDTAERWKEMLIEDEKAK